MLGQRLCILIRTIVHLCIEVCGYAPPFEKKWTEKRINSKAEWENGIYRNECSIQMNEQNWRIISLCGEIKTKLWRVSNFMYIINFICTQRFYVCIVLLLNSPIIIIVIDITFLLLPWLLASFFLCFIIYSTR